MFIQNTHRQFSPFDIKPSATLAINERCNDLENEGKKTYRMGFGQSPFPVPENVVESLKQHAHRKEYLPVQGLPELRNAISYFYKRKDGLEFKDENIMIGPGSKELMFLLQMVLDCELILPTPCWVSYAPQAGILNHKTHFIHTRFEDNWKLTPDLINEFLNKNNSKKLKLIIMNYPGNPSGTTYSDEDLIALSEIFRKENIFVLSDEIYGLLHHDGLHTSISNYYPEGTFVSSGLSKWCGAGGWRLGYMCFPNEHINVLNQVSALASETFSAVSAPIQYASVSAFNDSLSIHNYLFHVNRILKLIGQTCFKILDQDGINIIEPEGGFYLFPVFQSEKTNNKVRTSNDFCNHLLEKTGVASLPGSDFSRIQNEISCRLSYVNFDGNKALKISESVNQQHRLSLKDLSEVCRDLFEGMEKLIEFVSTAQ